MKKLMILPLLMLGLTGCPDGGRSSRNRNNPYPYPTYPQGCVNCGPNAYNRATLGQTITSTLPQGTLTLNLTADMPYQNNGTFYGNSIATYQGPVRVTGQLYLTTDLFLGNCRLPGGSQAYTIQSRQQGTFDRGSFYFPEIELIGPVRAIVTLTEGAIMSDVPSATGAGFTAWMVAMYGPSAWNFGYGGVTQTACGDSIGIRF